MRRPVFVLLSVFLAVTVLAPSETMANQVRCSCDLELILLAQTQCSGWAVDETVGVSKGTPDKGESSLKTLRRGVALLRFVVCIVKELLYELVEETFKGRDKS